MQVVPKQFWSSFGLLDGLVYIVDGATLFARSISGLIEEATHTQTRTQTIALRR